MLTGLYCYSESAGFVSSRMESLYGRHTEVASGMNKERSLLMGSDKIMPLYTRKPFIIISVDRSEREAAFQPCRKWWLIKCRDRPKPNVGAACVCCGRHITVL